MRLVRWLGCIRVALVNQSAARSGFSAPLKNFSSGSTQKMATSAILATPATPETIIIDGKKYRQVREGLASVLAPYAAGNSTSRKQNGKNQDDTAASSQSSRNNDEGHQAVFYNPIQQFNRDLSVLAMTVYGEGALLEKKAKHSQKVQHARSKKDKRRMQNLGASHPDQKPAAVSEQVNPRKRKADDLEDPLTVNTAEEPTKKLKADDEFEDDDDDIPVAELIAHLDSAEVAQAEQLKQNGHREPAKIGDQQATPKEKQYPFSILDALSATGLRALRYAKEIPFATHVVANDLSPASVEAIKLNIKHNNVEDKVWSNLGDAQAYMYSKVGNERPRAAEGYVHRFDIIDIDPYGTAAPFFDCSLQALQDGGMLCITCTDAGVFASNGYPEKSFALYGGMPIKGVHSHEGGLRLILNGIATSAAKYGLAIEPLLSLYIDYYARLFIRVHRKQNEVKLLPGTTMTVYNCGHGCGAWVTQPLLRNQQQSAKNGDTFYKFSYAQLTAPNPSCEHCGSRLHLCGPMWAGPLHNPYFVQKMLEKIPSLDKATYSTTDRLEGMLTLALEEDLNLQTSSADDANGAQPENRSKVDPKLIPRLATNQLDPSPFFFMATYLAKVIHCATPPEDAIRGALLGLGYKVTRSHCKAGSIKTNAPWSIIWEIIREYMRTEKPIKEGAVKQGTPGWNILAKLRGTERLLVSELKDATRDQLTKCDSKEDMKTILQGMLYRLGNERTNLDDESVEAVESGNQGEKARIPLVEAANPPQSRPGASSHPAPSKLKIVFDEKLGKEKPRGKLVRYQMNPRTFWGPMNRAGTAN